MAVRSEIRTVLTVTGMTCSHCERAVTEELSMMDGVQSVEVDLASGIVTVTSAGPLDRGDLREAIAEAGYQLAD